MVHKESGRTISRVERERKEEYARSGVKKREV